MLKQSFIQILLLLLLPSCACAQRLPSIAGELPFSGKVIRCGVGYPINRVHQAEMPSSLTFGQKAAVRALYERQEQLSRSLERRIQDLRRMHDSTGAKDRELDALTRELQNIKADTQKRLESILGPAQLNQVNYAQSFPGFHDALPDRRRVLSCPTASQVDKISSLTADQRIAIAKIYVQAGHSDRILYSRLIELKKGVNRIDEAQQSTPSEPGVRHQSGSLSTQINIVEQQRSQLQADTWQQVKLQLTRSQLSELRAATI